MYQHGTGEIGSKLSPLRERKLIARFMAWCGSGETCEGVEENVEERITPDRRGANRFYVQPCRRFQVFSFLNEIFSIYK